jgi:hypothetical protein
MITIYNGWWRFGPPLANPHTCNLYLIRKEYIKMSLVRGFTSRDCGFVIQEGGFYSDRKLFADFRCFLIAAYFITHSQLSY